MNNNKLNKAFYNTILSQTFTPCGNYLIVGDIYGTISIFHLSNLINSETSITKDEQLPKNSFTIQENVQINSLLTTEYFLIVGTVGEIFGYCWKDIKSNKKISCAWSITIPDIRDSFEKPDINSLIFNKETGLLYAAADNNVYVFDLESRMNLRSLKGHEDYIHCLTSSFQNNQIISGGEDGKVLLWDNRDNKIISKIQPYLKDKIARKDVGKWIGAVGINDDWLLCGGGPRLSLWHLRSLNPSTIFPINDRGIHVAEIYKDKIFAGGKSPLFYQMNFNGNIITEIPTSHITTYSAIHQEEPFQTLCIAGSSPKIDVCSNFIYRNLLLSLY